jgi:2-isopropylmalate synthase
MSPAGTRRRILLYDTTLRDGEQAPDINLGAAEKLQVARALAAAGADVVEAGFPVTSTGEFEAVRAVADGLGPGPPGRPVTVAALARATRTDIVRAHSALAGAARARITVFVPVSEIQATASGLSLGEVARRARDGVHRARDLVEDVQLSLGDAPRAHPGFLAERVREAAEAGTGTIALVDSVGTATPMDFARTVAGAREALADHPTTLLSVHCHDDLGLAVANAFAGVLAGGGQVECAVNGLGERAGNTALEEIAMLLRLKGPTLDLDCGIVPGELPELSALVERLTGYAVARNKAVVGRNAFVHSAGVHQDAIGVDPASYQVVPDPAAAAGAARPRLALGKHTSLAGLRTAFEQAGVPVTGGELATAFRRLKALADAGSPAVTLEELHGAPDPAQGGSAS